jgi:hypothetical protein
MIPVFIPKQDDGFLNPFISQQIRAVFRDGHCKLSSVNKERFPKLIKEFNFHQKLAYLVRQA